MRDPRSTDPLDPVTAAASPALPAQQPALSWLAESPTRRRSAVLALLALPPAPDADRAAPGAGAAAVDGLSEGGVAAGGVAVGGAAMGGAAMDGAAVDGATVDEAAVDGAAVDGMAVDGAAVAGTGEVLPRRAPARPAPRVPGPRAPVLDRLWARDQDTLQRLLVGLRAL